jgi:hypothetical protein
MKYSACHDAYQDGVNSRLAHPLHSGLYKLVESKDRIERTGKEIVRISEVITNRRHPADLLHCTFQDKAFWLRDVPFNVAYRMGYEIIPGLRALAVDGVTPCKVESAARSLESVIDQHLAQWDQLRNSYNKRIAYEYASMGKEKSNALAVVEDALTLINSALCQLPNDIQAEI